VLLFVGSCSVADSSLALIKYRKCNWTKYFKNYGYTV